MGGGGVIAGVIIFIKRLSILFQLDYINIQIWQYINKQTTVVKGENIKIIAVFIGFIKWF